MFELLVQYKKQKKVIWIKNEICHESKSKSSREVNTTKEKYMS